MFRLHGSKKKSRLIVDELEKIKSHTPFWFASVNRFLIGMWQKHPFWLNVVWKLTKRCEMCDSNLKVYISIEQFNLNVEQIFFSKQTT